uniref:BTB domain-containing protein n=1 Tax=Oryza punctata TaxID=4537 RepID=A0A0E0LWW3_ORYPU
MVGSADGSDVSFSVDGETFHAHRAVLAGVQGGAPRLHGGDHHAVRHAACMTSAGEHSSIVSKFTVTLPCITAQGITEQSTAQLSLQNLV